MPQVRAKLRSLGQVELVVVNGDWELSRVWRTMMSVPSVRNGQRGSGQNGLDHRQRWATVRGRWASVHLTLCHRMNYRGAILTDIERLLELFSGYCADRETLDELLVVVRSPMQWHTAHDLFQRIRKKTLVAERTKNATALAQCLFEEICAKTLYNLSGAPAPFDADSPYWVVPNAIALGRRVNVTESAVLDSVSLQGE